MTDPKTINEKAREMGFYSYQDYLTRSPHWHMLRRQYSRVPCYACGEWHAFHLDLHHISYDRLGAEWPSDLVKMCKFCHKFEHELIRAGLATLEDGHEITKEHMQKSANQLGLPLEAA